MAKLSSERRYELFQKVRTEYPGADYKRLRTEADFAVFYMSQSGCSVRYVKELLDININLYTYKAYKKWKSGKTCTTTTRLMEPTLDKTPAQKVVECLHWNIPIDTACEEIGITIKDFKASPEYKAMK